MLIGDSGHKFVGYLLAKIWSQMRIGMIALLICQYLIVNGVESYINWIVLSRILLDSYQNKRLVEGG